MRLSFYANALLELQSQRSIREGKRKCSGKEGEQIHCGMLLSNTAGCSNKNVPREVTCNTAPQNNPLSGERMNNFSAGPFLSSSHWSKSKASALSPFLDCVTQPLQTANGNITASAVPVQPEDRHSIPPFSWQGQQWQVRLARAAPSGEQGKTGPNSFRLCLIWV